MKYEDSENTKADCVNAVVSTYIKSNVGRFFGTPGTVDDNDNVQKRICIIHFEDCKHEEKFNHFHECQNAEERISKIHDIRRRRSDEPVSSAQRMDFVCQLIPNEMQPEHGSHRECYQRFTMNLGRFKQGASMSMKRIVLIGDCRPQTLMEYYSKQIAYFAT